jgi:DNA (cytosine-5)-methyltransferase 1
VRTNRGIHSRALPPFTAIDLFAGCGGLTEGLKRGGFKVIGAIELNADAAATYRLNHSSVNLLEQDIRTVDPATWRNNLGLRTRDLGLLAGCPPCQGFSTLRTQNGSKRNADRRNTLARELLRFATVFMPQAVMMENVPGLVGKLAFRELIRGLTQLGYIVKWDIRDVADYGVPQRRRRLIVLAGRGFALPFAMPSKEAHKTVRSAIGKLPPAVASGDALHDLPETRSRRVQRIISQIPLNGGSRTSLPKRSQLECHKRCNGFKDIYGRMAWDKVAPTITTGCFNPSKGRFLHPEKDRCITMREAALLQSFPRKYKFQISSGKIALASMIGNALPPEFIRRHAVEVSKALSLEAKKSAGKHGSIRG